MAAKITCRSLEDLKDISIQHLPCTVNKNGHANISTYFEQSEETTDDGQTRMSSTFRGRSLDGESVLVPTGYVGLVTEEKKRPFSEDEDRNIEVCGRFEKFTKWHYDSRYTSASTIEGALRVFPDIAAAIHCNEDCKMPAKELLPNIVKTS